MHRLVQDLTVLMKIVLILKEGIIIFFCFVSVSIIYYRGLPQITVPLPSRKETCRFTLRPISNSVGDFVQMLKEEDKGIDRVAVQSLDGVRIAASNSIESLLEEHFKLIINDTTFIVNTPPQERLTQEEIKR